MPPALPLPTNLELADLCGAFLSVAFSGVTFRLEHSEPLVRRTPVRLLQCDCEACARKEGRRSRAPPPANLDSDILILLGQVSSQLLHLSQRSRLTAFGRAYAAASLVHERLDAHEACNGEDASERRREDHPPDNCGLPPAPRFRAADGEAVVERL